jgi:hypothetical protein
MSCILPDRSRIEPFGKHYRRRKLGEVLGANMNSGIGVSFP